MELVSLRLNSETKMKRFIFFVVLFFISLTFHAQDTFYNYLSMGKNEVGYCDSLLFDSEITYSQYSYSGSSPLFIQIWFPLKKSSNNSYMTWGDFRNRKVPENLRDVYAELSNKLDESAISYNIANDINDDEPIDYGNLTNQDILNQLKQIQTRSKSSPITNTAYPVIVYHHGSQGLSDENSTMAEFFASHGFIFISSNFHLPYPNMPFGLLPYDLEVKSKHDQSSAKAILQFARTLAKNKPVVFVGHSWGAQEGWCFLHEDNYADAFVSMETTIEFKNDSTRIKELWPFVYDAIKVKRNQFSIPILHFAATDEDKCFEFFKHTTIAQNIQAVIKQPFAHNSYTSLYMMRYFLNQDIVQPDKEILKNQIELYADHLELILAFFDSIQKKKSLTTQEFEDRFYLN